MITKLRTPRSNNTTRIITQAGCQDNATSSPVPKKLLHIKPKKEHRDSTSRRSTTTLKIQTSNIWFKDLPYHLYHYLLFINLL